MRATRCGEVGRTPCKCVTTAVDILREGLSVWISPGGLLCDYCCGHSPGGLERVDIAGRAPV